MRHLILAAAVLLPAVASTNEYHAPRPGMQRIPKWGVNTCSSAGALPASRSNPNCNNAFQGSIRAGSDAEFGAQAAMFIRRTTTATTRLPKMLELQVATRWAPARRSLLFPHQRICCGPVPLPGQPTLFPRSPLHRGPACNLRRLSMSVLRHCTLGASHVTARRSQLFCCGGAGDRRPWDTGSAVVTSERPARVGNFPHRIAVRT